MTDEAEAEVLPLEVASPAFGDSGDPQAFLNADQRAGAVVAGKPSYTVDQAAAQLDRAGLSWSGALGQGAVVSYAFRADAPATLPTDATGFSRFNSAQIAAAKLSLQAWSDVANITFQQVTDTLGDHGGVYSNNATILFSDFSGGDAAKNAAAFTYLPGSRAASAAPGDVWVNATLAYNVTPVSGDYGQQVLTHELGHAIGLSHPSDYDAGDKGDADITYAANASYYEDSRQYSIMSYFASANTGASASIFAAAPQLDDIAAAQRMYGANYATRSGDTVYGIGNTTGEPWYGFDSDGHIYAAIWDGGGNDTLNFSGGAANQVIDLREGAFSNVGGDIGNVAIAVGAKIENAVSAAGDDMLIGNGLNNLLQAGAGADTLVASAGADTLDGGAGFDTVSFAGLSKSYAASFTQASGGPEGGADTLVSIESLAFADGTLTTDPASIAAQAARLYDALGQPVSARDLESGEQTLLHGGALTSVAQAVLARPEFVAELGADTSDAHFVTVLFQALLHRTPDAAGVAFQVAALQGGGASRAQLLINIAEGPEHQLDDAASLSAGLWQADTRIEGLVLFYDAAFGRTPDAGGEATFLSQLAAGASLKSLAPNFTSSSEFGLHVPTTASDTQFVDALYQQVLHRTADASGERFFTGLLSGGESRGDVFYDFAFSLEHQLHTLSHPVADFG